MNCPAILGKKGRAISRLIYCKHSKDGGVTGGVLARFFKKTQTCSATSNRSAPPETLESKKGRTMSDKIPVIVFSDYL
jgi:hypothetical protein